ncbi:unnamed protein product [Pseudo-nitzschia multistriata]|uniref:Uncharacterized protein n=1 Tax=Pseudo-nitzschia multistriata TaxID=183589 RepID=A0A448ZRZ0_9STRA|nr:unnamed protein product [Pseudo-nitzschia multistriata]
MTRGEIGKESTSSIIRCHGSTAMLIALLLSLTSAWTSEAFVAVLKSPAESMTMCRTIGVAAMRCSGSGNISPMQSGFSTTLFSSNEDEDDGWGTSPTETEGSGTTPSTSLETDRKLSELRSLQTQASNRSQATTTNSSSSGEEPERDMFIPIMAVVSLAGLFGAYGYETLRLASRGELYLPF